MSSGHQVLVEKRSEPAAPQQQRLVHVSAPGNAAASRVLLRCPDPGGRGFKMHRQAAALEGLLFLGFPTPRPLSPLGAARCLRPSNARGWGEANLRASWDLAGPAHRRRQWHPTPVLLPGKSRGWRSLEGCSPWGREESDTTERLHFHFSLSCIGEGTGNPLQCSCLENPRDGGAWWAAVYGVAQSRTRLTRLSRSSSAPAVRIPPALRETLVPFLGGEDAVEKGIGYPLQYSWASLEAQLVKNLPEMRETWARSLGREDALTKGTATHSSIPAWRIPSTEELAGYSPRGLTGSDMTERLSTAQTRQGWRPAGGAALCPGVTSVLMRV